ncbi:MAG: hypothetical protein ACK4M9_03435 [Anaerobacillus sp.]|uniref:hypothetical protein n=1 Tax=Anaerobacillus sp. TaxID=1872506 RepID=UPI0039197821
MLKFMLFALKIAILIFIIHKNKTILKQLTLPQLTGVGSSYIFTVFIAFIFIYYGRNWIVDEVKSRYFGYIIFLFIICVTIYLCKFILGKVLIKITNGVLPSSWK